MTELKKITRRRAYSALWVLKKKKKRKQKKCISQIENL